MSTQRVAVIQMNSGADLGRNLMTAARLIAAAAEDGAKLVVLPEYFYLMGESEADRLPLAESVGRGPIQEGLAEAARQAGVWLVAGTVPLQGPDPHHVYNASLLFDDRGECRARYDKVHLFGFTGVGETYREADTLAPGHDVVTAQTPVGALRMSVCYDLRFPELYRRGPAPELISAPAAFTHTTGQAHWETLLRARAIENQAYVLAAAQWGVHPNGKRTFGHSMIVDPWGTVLACRPEGEGFAAAEVDEALLLDVRERLPALKNRVLDR